MLQRIAFVDHSHHRYTHSSDFFLNLLKDHFDVEVFWDDRWDGGAGIDLKALSAGRFDVVVIWQVFFLYSPEELGNLSCKNIVAVPMYDGVGEESEFFWLKYKHCKFLTFSRVLHDRLSDWGLTSLYVQYFVSSNNHTGGQTFDGLSGFFWERTNSLSWEIIKRLISRAAFSHFHIHSALDPGEPSIKPTAKDIQRWGLTFSSWTPHKNEYIELLSKSKVFFAPRLYEGIGMSFLEAMSMGKCVVAPKNPTMSEYIEHGKTGLLYNPWNPKPLDFSKVDAICRQAAQYASEGREKWLLSHDRILTFLSETIVAPMQASARYNSFRPSLNHGLNTLLLYLSRKAPLIYRLIKHIFPKNPFSSD